MDFIVLDTIHGGLEIARALEKLGHHADAVDVYRGTGGTDSDLLNGHHYDRAVVPVHLDPENKILRRFEKIPVISHHEATGWIISRSRPHPMIEVTGSQGKTTTAYAIAHLFESPGILHTSCGTFRYPEREFLFRKSITPASLISLMDVSGATSGWLVAEESLGVTGAGDIAVITSAGDYRCAGGKKSALLMKVNSADRSPVLVAAPGVESSHPRIIHVQEHIAVKGERCTFDLNGISGRFENPLLKLTAYAVPLMTAAATGCMIGISPAGLSTFSAIPGRMASSLENGHLIIDNANTGTGRETSREAAVYARMVSGEQSLILVTGQESNAVCEGFPPDEVIRTIRSINPDIVYIVGDQRMHDRIKKSVEERDRPSEIIHSSTLEEAKNAAIAQKWKIPIILAVKSWR